MPLARTLKYQPLHKMRGDDVEAHNRGMAILRGELRTFSKQPDDYRQTFTLSSRAATKWVQRKAGIPQTGWIGPATHEEILDRWDGWANALNERYAESLKPKLIEPRQGWDSLHRALWRVYSEGIRRGFSDLGTHNAASTLPSGAPSDHSVWPAYAIDFGIEPDTGWQNLKARAFVLWLAHQREVEYSILGDRIHFGLFSRKYWNGGHLNHIHVSGIR